MLPETDPSLIPFFDPRGVVLIIGPWNYPLLLVLTDALPALLAGNAVVVKPAETTPFAALWGARLLYEAGLPPELFHVVPGYGEDAGSALVDEVDYVHFTGSTAVGRIVAVAALSSLLLILAVVGVIVGAKAWRRRRRRHHPAPSAKAGNAANFLKRSPEPFL